MPPLHGLAVKHNMQNELDDFFFFTQIVNLIVVIMQSHFLQKMQS